MNAVLLAAPVTAADDANVTAWAAGAVIIGIMGYVGSLVVHPYANCRWCRGSGRHRGVLFTYSHRVCTRCGGNGRKARLGRRLFFSGVD